jgi:hypothetical protein
MADDDTGKGSERVPKWFRSASDEVPKGFREGSTRRFRGFGDCIVIFQHKEVADGK